MARRPGGSGRARGTTTWRRFGAALAVLSLFASPLFADEPRGSGDRAARSEAADLIPWERIAPADSQAAQKIVGRPSLYRSLPTRVIDCDAHLFSYLADHPEVIVDCWNVMGVSRLRLTPTGPGEYEASDSVGARGVVRVLHRQGGGTQPLLMVIHATGVYQTPPMPQPLRGASVMVLRAEPSVSRDGRPRVTARLDTFLRFEQLGTKLVAKTLQPLITRTADHNFVETMRFLDLFNRTAETNPSGMRRLSHRLPRTDEPTRQEFARVIQQTSNRYALLRQRHAVRVTPTSLRR